MSANTPLSLHAAALTLAAGPDAIHDAEVALAHAIEHGELRANVKRASRLRTKPIGHAWQYRD